MNRLIAYRSSAPERLRTVLRSHPDALPNAGGRGGGSDKTPVPGEGEVQAQEAARATQWARWGVGFYVGGEALVQRWSDEPGRGLGSVLDLRADNLIAQAHLIGAGDTSTQNSTAGPPFRFRCFTFAAQGALSGLSQERQARNAELPDFLRVHLRGASNAEALFYQFLLRLHEAEPTYLTRPELPAEVAVAALGQVMHAAAGPVSEDHAPAQHAALSNGSWLLVARCGPQPLWYRAVAGLGEGEEDFRAIFATADANADTRPAEAGLIEVPDNYALIIGADLDFQILPLSL